jgi:hypothetical protein
MKELESIRKKMHYLKTDKFELTPFCFPCPELMICKIIKYEYAADSCPISNV